MRPFCFFIKASSSLLRYVSSNRENVLGILSAVRLTAQSFQQCTILEETYFPPLTTRYAQYNAEWLSKPFHCLAIVMVNQGGMDVYYYAIDNDSFPLEKTLLAFSISAISGYEPIPKLIPPVKIGNIIIDRRREKDAEEKYASDICG